MTALSFEGRFLNARIWNCRKSRRLRSATDDVRLISSLIFLLILQVSLCRPVCGKLQQRYLQDVGPPVDQSTDRRKGVRGNSARRREKTVTSLTRNGGTVGDKGSKDMMGKSKKSTVSNNVFLHDNYTSTGVDDMDIMANETSAATNGTATADYNSQEGNDYSVGNSTKEPLQPVFCGQSQSIHSALLVRMIGEPFLLTRYEKLTLQDVVLNCYNSWMRNSCDGYHRSIQSVDLRPVDGLPLNGPQQGSPIDTQARNEIDSQEDGRYRQLLNESVHDNNTISAKEQPTQSPTSAYYDDPDLYYRPLYWLSISATCRSCPVNKHGNSNLLSSQAVPTIPANIIQTHGGASYATFRNVTASSLIMKDVCYCPLPSEKTAINASGTNDTAAPLSIDRFFPKATAPTSMSLLDSINQRIKELRTMRRIIHIDRLVQLTEPDYAYYAQQMTESPSREAEKITDSPGPAKDTEQGLNLGAFNATTTITAATILTNMTFSNFTNATSIDGLNNQSTSHSGNAAENVSYSGSTRSPTSVPSAEDGSTTTQGTLAPSPRTAAHVAEKSYNGGSSIKPLNSSRSSSYEGKRRKVSPGIFVLPPLSLVALVLLYLSVYHDNPNQDDDDDK